MTLIMSEVHLLQRRCIMDENRTVYIRVRLGVLAAVNMKITVFRDVTLCTLVDGTSVLFLADGSSRFL